jgi:hypothetical protein
MAWTMKVSAIAVCATAALAFQSSDEILLSRVRTAVSGNIRQMPRYTCVQTVNRTRFGQPASLRSCDEAVAARAKQFAAWRDRLRLDVAVGDGTDMYSWVGASRFDNDQVRQLAARGMSASGEFSALLAGVFSGDAGDFRFLGDQATSGSGLPSFSFVTPRAKSHYSYGTSIGHATVGYHGTFSADPVSADLRQLKVEADDLPSNICRMASTVDYARLKIGAGSFVLPTTSTVDVLYLDGTESRNVTSYSGCREYSGESTIHFDGEEGPVSPGEAPRKVAAVVPPLPSHTRLHVRIAPQVDTKIAAAGDPITGVIDAAVRDQEKILVSAGDKLHGRILRLEELIPTSPSAEQASGRGSAAVIKPNWVITMVFDTIERGGVEQKVRLRAVDDGYRFDAPRPAIADADRPAGGGIFIFSSEGDFVLGQKFESAWETQ